MSEIADSRDNENNHSNAPVVKFVPFSSAVESAFWVRYFRKKLETIRLKEDAIPLRLVYSVVPTTGGGPPRLQCQDTSLLLLPSAAAAEEPSDAVPTILQPTNHNNTMNECVAVNASLLGYNTLESFQKVDKNEFLRSFFLNQFFPNNNENTGDADDATTDAMVVDSLNSAVLIAFADLKSHTVVYWFGMPAFMPRTSIAARRIVLSSGCSSSSRMLATPPERRAFEAHFGAMRHRQMADVPHRGLPPYFIYSRRQQQYCCCAVLSKESYAAALGNGNEDDLVFGCMDPIGYQPESSSGDEVPSSSSSLIPMGWPLRNLVAYLAFHLNLGGSTVTVLSYRPKVVRRLFQSDHSTTNTDVVIDHSNDNGNTCLVDDGGDQYILMKVSVPTVQDFEWSDTDTAAEETATPPKKPSLYSQKKYKVVGWELNARLKAGPRSVNLRPLLDPQHLAMEAADLNLKLMKWRMIPDLNVDLLQSSKVLLLGAGTLGCNVARVLLGWGIRHFTIVDNGRVSYSNPVRQSLFTLEDCHADGGRGRPKAVAAAAALSTIAADVHSRGLSLSIPMPGHAEDPAVLKNSIETLDTLIREADAVFLLTDTRESRWLPTVMAASHNKILINAALGLDSWLVMRHGAAPSEPENPLASSPSRLGCYFCSDVVAPENSTKNRTLDQQCTVTRPGLALIASSMAVELLVSILHHPLRQAAPSSRQSSSFATTASTEDASACPLGVIPHQIRGSLVSYTMMTPTIPAFRHCTGCSSHIVEAYRRDKFGLVSKCCQTVDGSYLEEISGLTSFHAESAEKLMEVEGWDDEEVD